jgi:hypothetical protein
MFKLAALATAVPAALAAVSAGCCSLGWCCGTWWCVFC